MNYAEIGGENKRKTDGKAYHIDCTPPYNYNKEKILSKCKQ